MSSQQSLYFHLQDLNALFWNLLPLHRDTYIHSCASCTACNDYAFLLIIKVDQLPAPQHGQINPFRASQSCLFLGCHNHFQTRMADTLFIQQCQNISNRDTIITAQARTLRGNPAVLDIQTQRISPHINITVRILHRDHVHMSLQNIWLLPFISGRCLLDNNNIVQFVLNILQSPVLRKFLQIIADLFLIA